jgi:DNA repair exonuclease SbcCD ATPase subunit
MKEKRLVKILLNVLFCISSTQLFAASVDEVQEQVRKATQSSAKTQQEINHIDALNKEQDRQYLAILSNLDQLKKNNQHLEKQLEIQNQDLASLHKQLTSVAQIDREIEPLMLEMQHALQSFVAADLPFLEDSRKQALANLKENLLSVNLSLSEKYQQLMQAYVTEIEYSKAIHSYQGELVIGETEKQVIYYRLGRVAFYYQSLDKQQGSQWSSSLKKWNLLSEGDNAALAKAIDVANELKIPQLIELPFVEVAWGAEQ